MPLPKTSDIGRVISFLKKDKPKMGSKQRIAIALSQSKKHGFDKETVKMARMMK